MKILKRRGFTELQADENKFLVQIGETSGGAKAVVLAKSDSTENWEEIDELAADLPEFMTLEADVLEEPEYQIIPDEEGKIDYETAQKMQEDIQMLKRRMLELEENQNK